MVIFKEGRVERMYWSGLLIDVAIAGFGFIAGMLIMAIVACNGRYKATTEAYNIGYENGVKEEQERIGKLVDKYIEDLERGKRRDSEGVSIADNLY